MADYGKSVVRTWPVFQNHMMFGSTKMKQFTITQPAVGGQKLSPLRENANIERGAHGKKNSDVSLHGLFTSASHLGMKKAWH